MANHFEDVTDMLVRAKILHGIEPFVDRNEVSIPQINVVFTFDNAGTLIQIENRRMH